MAECDGKSESLQFAVPVGQCGGILSLLSNQTTPRSLGVATDCDGLPAEQWSRAESEIAALLELCRSGQPVPLGCRSATGNRRARSCQGAQYLSLSRVRWTSQILMVETTVGNIAAPPPEPPFASLLSEHAELMSWSGRIVTLERDRLRRRRGGGKATTRCASFWREDGWMGCANAMTCWWVLIRRRRCGHWKKVKVREVGGDTLWPVCTVAVLW